jgi:Family of unknown function (DUF6459)
MSTTAGPASRTVARQVPLPAREPPFDDERELQPPPSRLAPATQGSLALAHLLPSGLPALPEPASALRLVDVGAPAPAPGVRRSTEPKRLGDPPDARRWSARLAQGIAEALSGHRPVQQLVRWTDDAVYEMLTHRITARTAARGPRPVVRSVRICRPCDGVLEATAIIDVSGRSRALALRLEAEHEHWRCTALDIV